MDAGGIRTLISGKSDFDLVSEGSQFSYFLQEYKARPKFQTQMIPVNFRGTCFFGDQYTHTLPMAGDLITRIYLKINLPQLPSQTFYATSIGNYLFEYVELLLNGVTVEKCYGEFIEMMEEIEVPLVKQPLLAKLVGKDVSNLSGPNTMYIKLPFSLCEQGIPLLAVKQGSFEIRVKYRDSKDFTFPSYLLTKPIDGEFLIEYVYLGETEAKYFQDKKRTYLIQQTQRYQGTIASNVTSVSHRLNFTNPVKELFFVVQNQKLRQKVFDFNYLGSPIDSSGRYDWYRITYGKGIFLAYTVYPQVGLSYSQDNGNSWILVKEPKNLFSIAYGDGYFVGVTYYGLSSYSSDGITWSEYTGSELGFECNISYGNGVFILITLQPFGDKVQYSSSDNGMSWNEGNLKRDYYDIYVEDYVTYPWIGVVTSGIGFVAYTYDGYISYTSDNGEKWTEPNQIVFQGDTGPNNYYYTITDMRFGDGYFVVVIYFFPEGFPAYIRTMYSRDNGQTWTYGNDTFYDLYGSNNWYVTYGNGYFILISPSGTTYYSTNHGINWTKSNNLPTLTSGHEWYHPAFGNGVFINVGGDQTAICDSTNITVWSNYLYLNNDNINNLELNLNGFQIITQDIGIPLYLRVVQPMDYHTRIPGTNFYMYSFCLDPENPNPTGHINFGRISDQILNINLVKNPLPRFLRVYARSYNIFIVEKGIAKVLFNTSDG